MTTRAAAPSASAGVDRFFEPTRRVAARPWLSDALPVAIAGGALCVLYGAVRLVPPPPAPWDTSLPMAAGWATLAGLAVACARLHLVPPPVLVAVLACLGALAGLAPDWIAAPSVVVLLFCAAAIVVQLVERLWWTVLLVPAALSDLWSVYSSHGITRQLVADEDPTLGALVTYLPGWRGTPQLHLVGLVDVGMFAVLCALCGRFSLSLPRTLLACASVPVVVWVADRHEALVPLIPVLAPAFLIANWRTIRWSLRWDLHRVRGMARGAPPRA